MRPSGRSTDQLRSVSIETEFNPYAEGSCLIRLGNTHVTCTATVEDSVPGFLRNTGKGWVTAEYGMLPRATHLRVPREAATGKQSGRTQEIQRLIGRSLRAVLDMSKLGERQIKIDCDVLQADGGTRCASITGGYVALAIALRKIWKSGDLLEQPLMGQVAAVSCGIYNAAPILDLDYAEDRNAQADANFVLTSKGSIVEIQATAEEKPFSENEFNSLFALAKTGVTDLCAAQTAAIDAAN